MPNIIAKAVSSHEVSYCNISLPTIHVVPDIGVSGFFLGDVLNYSDGIIRNIEPYTHFIGEIKRDRIVLIPAGAKINVEFRQPPECFKIEAPHDIQIVDGDTPIDKGPWTVKISSQ